MFTCENTEGESSVLPFHQEHKHVYLSLEQVCAALNTVSKQQGQEEKRDAFFHSWTPELMKAPQSRAATGSRRLRAGWRLLDAHTPLARGSQLTGRACVPTLQPNHISLSAQTPLDSSNASQSCLLGRNWCLWNPGGAPGPLWFPRRTRDGDGAARAFGQRAWLPAKQPALLHGRTGGSRARCLARPTASTEGPGWAPVSTKSLFPALIFKRGKKSI